MSARDKPLSWQLVAAAFVAFAAIFVAILAFAADISPRTAHPLRWLFAAMLLSIAVLCVSHARVYGREDREPDVLVQLFPEEDIYETGAAHFCLTHRQQAGELLIQLVVQNRQEGRGWFYLRLKPAKAAHLAAPIPAVRFPLEGAAVTKASLRMPLLPGGADSVVRFRMKARSGARGRLVRSNRRRHLRGESGEVCALISTMLGHLHVTETPSELHVFLRSAPESSTPGAKRVEWTWETLWSPDRRKSVRELSDSVIGTI